VLIVDVRDAQVEIVVDAWHVPSIPVQQVVVEAATTFLRSQQQLLRRGLDEAGDDAVVAEVTAGHDASHEAWLSTISALRDHVPAAVTDEVLDLYGFHGRVAGGLAGERSLRLPGPIETGVRRILADQLDQMTDRVVATLEDLADADPTDER
jgi:hypothetical protein